MQTEQLLDPGVNPLRLLEDSEIEPGLVAFLSPTILEKNGCQTSCAPQFRTRMEHPFVCLARDGEFSMWLPLSSHQNPNASRLRIPPEAKEGSDKWCRTECFVIHPNQVWRGPNSAFIAASRFELSQRFNRNRVHLDYLAALAEEIAAVSGWRSPIPPPPAPSVPEAQSVPVKVLPCPVEPKPETPTAAPVSASFVIHSEPPVDLAFDAALYSAVKAYLARLNFLASDQRKALEDRKRALEAEQRQLETEWAALHGSPVAARADPIRKRAAVMMPVTKENVDTLRLEIVELLRERGAMRTKDITDSLSHRSNGQNLYAVINNALNKPKGGLIADGLVRRIGWGVYEAVSD